MITRISAKAGIPDLVFAILESISGSIVGQVMIMPICVIAATRCGRSRGNALQRSDGHHQFWVDCWHGIWIGYYGSDGCHGRQLCANVVGCLDVRCRVRNTAHIFAHD